MTDRRCATRHFLGFRCERAAGHRGEHRHGIECRPCDCPDPRGGITVWAATVVAHVKRRRRPR